jgi:exodeoxyribonuclease V alpha subunit
MQTVIIESLLWQGHHGGAIFNATSSAGQRLRIVADREVICRAPVVGEVWDIGGVLRRHKIHGDQVEARTAVLRKPSGRLIIQAIAGSKKFPGIGEVRARALWERFGEEIYPLLTAGASEPFVDLLGPELSRILVLGWSEVEIEAEVYQWLDGHGLPVWLAKKLLAIYGPEVVIKLDENPYRILAFTSWLQAEKLARALNIEPGDKRRLIAAADAASYRRLAFAHTWSSLNLFVSDIGKLLNCNEEVAKNAANLALSASAAEKVGAGVQGVGPLSMERFIASRIKTMLAGGFEAEQMTFRRKATVSELSRIYTMFSARTGLGLNQAQKEAVRAAVTHPVACIKGGAGVGKTTTLRAVHLAAEMLGFGGVVQMALSGRAAKRMTEATGRKAYTIAGFLLGIDIGTIRVDGECLLIVDESSMLDLPHCYRIMRRMPPGTKLLLVGDDAQLPPIGFGLTFHAFANHLAVPTVELTEILRQDAVTGIPQASAAIRHGNVPEYAAYTGLAGGVSFIDTPVEEVADKLLDVVNDLGGIGSCQVIGAVKNGPAGVHTINHLFHQLLAAGRPEYHGFAEGEPVIWTSNDYKRNLFNGSLGTVASGNSGLLVEFEGVRHALDETDAREMEHAYAITVHKSQGSQFERVVVPVFPSRILDRTLLYTAITRAEKQVVLVGDREAFERAVVNAPMSSLRETGMAFHLDA